MPARPYRLAVVAILVGAAFLVVLAFHYSDSPRAGGPDRGVDAWLVARAQGHVSVVRTVSDLAGTIPASVLVVLLLGLALWTHSPRGAVLAAIASATSAITELVLKPLIHRTYAGLNSFPSGRSTTIFALAFVVLILMLNPQRPEHRWRTRQLVVALAFLVAGVVSAAVVAAKYHYATDTVAGASVALATVMGLALGIDAVADRRIRQRSSGVKPSRDGSIGSARHK